MKRALIALRNNFVVGFIAILPLALSLYIFFQLVGFVLGITDQLLKFLPATLRETEYKPLFRVVAFVVSVVFVTFLGFIARNVLGKTLLSTLESIALRVPLLNKIYGGIKQLFEAFSSAKTASFKRVVLVRFPYRDSYSVGFVTSEAPAEMRIKTGAELINVFVPTTPNPTSGFLLVVPRTETIALDMSVGDAVKMVISGGAVVPPAPAQTASPPAPNNPTPAPDGNR